MVTEHYEGILKTNFEGENKINDDVIFVSPEFVLYNCTLIRIIKDWILYDKTYSINEIRNKSSWLYLMNPIKELNKW